MSKDNSVWVMRNRNPSHNSARRRNCIFSEFFVCDSGQAWTPPKWEHASVSSIFCLVEETHLSSIFQRIVSSVKCIFPTIFGQRLQNEVPWYVSRGNCRPQNGAYQRAWDILFGGNNAQSIFHVCSGSSAQGEVPRCVTPGRNRHPRRRNSPKGPGCQKNEWSSRFQFFFVWSFQFSWIPSWSIIRAMAASRIAGEGETEVGKDPPHPVQVHHCLVCRS